MEKTVVTAARPMCFVATTVPSEAKTFYADVLGLEFVAEEAFALLFRLPGDVTLRVQKAGPFTPHPFTALGWQVDDIDAAVAQLSARGVAFEAFGFPGQDDGGICTFPNGDKVAWFKDPDGNTLSLAEIAA